VSQFEEKNIIYTHAAFALWLILNLLSINIFIMCHTIIMIIVGGIAAYYYSNGSQISIQVDHQMDLHVS